MTSRWGWSSKPMTHAIPPQFVSPQWWVWPGFACVSAWTGATTAMTSGGWWTPLIFSLLARVRRTETCCSRRWVRQSGEVGHEQALLPVKPFSRQNISKFNDATRHTGGSISHHTWTWSGILSSRISDECLLVAHVSVENFKWSRNGTSNSL